MDIAGEHTMVAVPYVSFTCISMFGGAVLVEDVANAANYFVASDHSFAAKSRSAGLSSGRMKRWAMRASRAWV